MTGSPVSPILASLVISEAGTFLKLECQKFAEAATRIFLHSRSTQRVDTLPLPGMEELHRRFGSSWERATNDGTATLFEPDGQPLAYFTASSSMHPHFLLQCLQIEAAYEPTASAEALPWLKDQLSKHIDREPTLPVFLDVNAQNLDLLPICSRLDLGVNSLELRGGVAEALSRLRASYGEFSDFAAHGIEIRPTELSDVPHIIELKKDFFTDNPGYCWFFNNDGFPEAELQRLENALNDQTAAHYVLEDRNGFAGSIAHDLPENRGTAGTDMMMAPRLHRRGLGKVAYSFLLASMLEAGIKEFSGYTANPGVIRLAEIMGRELLSCHLLGKGPTFPLNHFRSYLL